jgi:hypothetical protein
MDHTTHILTTSNSHRTLNSNISHADTSQVYNQGYTSLQQLIHREQ